ncbi:MAG: TetR/AcrR family transcriptional regulator [Chakrabartia sp.]
MSIAETKFEVPEATRANRANSRQRAQRAETRERLIDGAIRVFAASGYAQASIEDVLIEAGVSRASFYSHFAGKPALAEAIADALVPLWRPLFAELADMATPGLDQLRDWCGRNVALYRAHQDICMILTQASAIEPDLYWKLTAHREAVAGLMAARNPLLAHLAEDAGARLRATLALMQLDLSCYYLAVRHWQDAGEAGIEAMADQLHHFLTTESARGRA